MLGENPPTSPATPGDAPPGWERLGHYVVARRVELGHRQRPTFADASGMSVRILGDIELGRRGNYDPTTIAALENALGWETGSVQRVLRGGEPNLRSERKVFLSFNYEDDEALVRVMRSNLPDVKKRQLVQLLIAEREAADRQRLAHAEQLINLVEHHD